MRRSHLPWAVALSAASHAGLLALVMSSRPAPHWARESVEIELLVRRASPPPLPAHSKARNAAAPASEEASAEGEAPKARAPKAARSAMPPPALREPNALEDAGAPGAPPAAPAGEGLGQTAERAAALGDLPRAMPAGPSAELGEQMVEQGSRGSRTYGSLTRNEPGSGPGRQAQLDAERAVVKGRVDGWGADGAAEARANGGIVDDYFGEMKRRLEAKLDKPEGVLSGNFVEDFVAAYGHAAQQYAATGNPYRAGEVIGAAPEIDGDTPLAQMAQRLPEATPGRGGGMRTAVNQAAARASQARVLRDFADGKFGKGLLAVVELRQGGDGRLLEAKLLEPSGSAEFDAHVMRVAPQALSTLGPPPATAKIAEVGVRSHWAFEGHITYKRKLRDVNLAKDGLYLGIAGWAGMMTGDFDPGGDATYVDLRHPELKVKARLLRLYQ